MMVVGSALTTGMAAELYSEGVSAGVLTANVAAQDFCDWLADVIITHIQDNAQLDTTSATLLAPPGGGPCTGTAEIV